MRDGRGRDLAYYRCGNGSLWIEDLDRGLDESQYTEKYVSPDHPALSRTGISPGAGLAPATAAAPRGMLEIGCGNAALLNHARSDGWRVHGMEFSDSMTRAIEADQAIAVTVYDFLDYEPAPHESYNVVVLRHVLEHLPDSKRAMQRIGNLLAADRLAFLELPNTGFFAYATKRHLMTLGLRNAKCAADWRPGHCNEINKRSFRYLLDAMGFELSAWRTYSNKPIADCTYGLPPVASKVRVFARKKSP